MGTNTYSAYITGSENPDAAVGATTTDLNINPTTENLYRQAVEDKATYTRRRVDEMIGAPIAVSGVSAVSDLITTVAAHGISANDPVRIKALGAGAVPGGLSAGTVYYWLADGASTGKLSLTPGGSAVDITSAGTGPLYLYKSGSIAVVDRPIAGLWTASGGTGGNSFRPNFIAPGGTNTYHFPLNLLDGVIVTSVKLRIDPTDVGSLPGTMPRIALVRIENMTGSVVEAAAASDTSANATIYSAAHEVMIGSMSEVIDLTTYWYRLDFTSSSGDPTDNAISVLSPPRVSWTEVARLAAP